MSVHSMELAAIALLFLTIYHFPSATAEYGDEYGEDFCKDLVKTRPVKADEVVQLEAFYFCHPTIPNAYLTCEVGKPNGIEGKISFTQVIEERESECHDGFFNTDRKSCLPHPLSNCAAKFVNHKATDAQRICQAYRQTRPSGHSAIADLICHAKERQMFVVCPLNTAAAVTVPCVNGTYFNQADGKCINDPDMSDCPIEWEEVEREIDAAAGEMRESASPQCECVCKASLAASSSDPVYVSHPTADNKFLICTRDGQIYKRSCPSELSWNDEAKSCHTVARRNPVTGCSNSVPTPIATTQSPWRPLPTTAQPWRPIPITTTAQPWRPIPITTTAQPWRPIPITTTQPWRPIPITTTTQPWRPIPITTTKPIPTTLPPFTMAPTTRPTTTAITSAPTYPAYVPYCQYFYEYHPEKLNWFSAKRVCEANQGTLATIPDEGTQQLLRDRYGSTSKSKRVWVGASDRSREGTWQWVTGERFGFTNWYRNQPSSKRNEDCLSFNYYYEGMWSDEDCSDIKPFVCQHLVCSK